MLAFKKRMAPAEMCKNKKMQNIDVASMHKKIKETAGQKTCSSAGGCIKSKTRINHNTKSKDTTVMGAKYIKELFQDDRGEKPSIDKKTN